MWYTNGLGQNIALLSPFKLTVHVCAARAAPDPWFPVSGAAAGGGDLPPGRRLHLLLPPLLDSLHVPGEEGGRLCQEFSHFNIHVRVGEL